MWHVYRATGRGALQSAVAWRLARFPAATRGHVAGFATAPAADGDSSSALPPLVGVVGLGNMGWGMARALVSAGLPVVVWTRSPGKADAFVAEATRAGHGDAVRAAPAASTVAGIADVTITCLASEEVGMSVYGGDGGVVAGLRAPLSPPASEGMSRALEAHDVCRNGKPLFLPRWAPPLRVVVDCSTVGMGTTLSLREQVEGVGVQFLDAPISGTPERATNGDLTVMVGGEEAVVQRCRPVLSAIGSDVEHMGGPGAGAAMKLVNQLLASVHAVATAEALALARSLDLRDTAQVLRVVSSSSGSSLAFRRGAALLAELEARHGREGGISELLHAPAGAPLRLLRKDAGLAFVAGLKSGAGDLPVTAAARALYDRAAAAGLAEKDVMTLLCMLEDGRTS